VSADFWTGLAAIPGFLVFAALSVGIALGLIWLWARFTPPHWHLSGPQRRARPAAELFRWVDVAGGHAKSLRRLVRLGPYGFYVVRYAPGSADIPQPERIP
jgi:hypothetical protein